jgi:hypothetical protein
MKGDDKMSAKSREREQKRRPGVPVFRKEKEARDEAKKQAEETGTETIEVAAPTVPTGLAGNTGIQG